MNIDAESYDQMRAWFARIVPEALPAELVSAETDPVRCLDQLAVRSPAQARQGLAVAIGDTVEWTDGWPREKVIAVDNELAKNGLPSLTAVRLRFSKVIARVVKRGVIKNDVEYHAVRNAVDLTNADQDPLLGLLSAYERRMSPNAQ